MWTVLQGSVQVWSLILKQWESIEGVQGKRVIDSNRFFEKHFGLSVEKDRNRSEVEADNYG